MRGLAAACVLVAACGYPGLPDLVDAPPPTPTMDVQGTAIVHYVADTMSGDAPRDFSKDVTFVSITPEGTGFKHRLGKGTATGSFTVAVDQGAPSWYLGDTFTGGTPFYLVGNATAPDLGYEALGRPDTTVAANPPTVDVNATGLAAWQAYDDLEILSSNAGALWFGPQYAFPTYPANGTTTLTGQDFKWTNAPLIVAAKGDTVQLLQLSTASSGSDFYAALSRIGSATGFTLTDGQTSYLSVALGGVIRNKTLTVHWKRSLFDALRGQAGPGAIAMPYGSYLAIDALPGAAAHGFYSSAPDLAEFLYPPAGTTDLDETFTYGNPFTTSGVAWDEFVIASYQFDVPVTASGATSSTNVSAGYYGQLWVPSLNGNGTIFPVVSGVRSVTVGGMDVTVVAKTGVGATPVVSWAPPADGTVTTYQVTVESVTAQSGMTVITPVATFETTGTTLQIPDKVLATGTSYMLAIVAFASPGTDFTVRPNEAKLPAADFLKVTAQFTP